MATTSISVVINCYTEGRLLLEAVASAEAQRPAPLEIILVNDASPDAATDAACDEAERRGCRVLRRVVNGGLSAARNDGFDAARGEVMVPLDADDLLPPGSLERIGRAFDATPAADFVYGAYLRQTGPGVSQMVTPGPPNLARLLAAKPLWVTTQWDLLGTTPLRRTLWERAGRYDTSYGTRDLHDVEFWLRAISVSHGHACADGPIYVWRKYLGNTSRTVGPEAWARLATEHLGTYRRLGLEHRAHELLLLDAKWRGDAEAVSRQRALLLRSLRPLRARPSTLASLLVPGAMVRALRSLGLRR